MTLRLSLLLLCSTALLACGPSDTSTQADTAAVASIETSEAMNQRLDAWFETKFMESARRSPQRLASLGIKERMDEWNDPSRAFALETLDMRKQSLAELRDSFDFDKLDADRQLSYRLYEMGVERAVEGSRYFYHNYAFNQMFGTHATIPTFLINQHRIDTVEDAQAYIARLNGVPAYLGGVLENSRESVTRGIMPPSFVYPYVLSDAKNILKGEPYEDGELSLILADFKKKVDKLEIDDATREALFTDAIAAMEESVGPAYLDLIEEMERQQAMSDAKDGAWKLPNGGEFYAYRLEGFTTPGLSAKDIHDLGLSEVDRIHAEMREIMEKVGYKGDLQSFFTYMREAPQFFKPETKTGKKEYLKEATAFIDIMEQRLPDVFHRTPKAPLEVRAVEPFREKSAGKAFYNRPSADGSRPGIYYANLYRTANMPTYQMEALAYHEGIPGHHMQISIAQELENVPKFRKFGGYTPYSEGWGLYSEYLPKEMGFYEDPYSDFGRLAMELWRAARLVVDTGLHDKKWTREEAIDYLVTNTPNPEGDCVKAIERYIVMPGQATAYKVGMLKILELRDRAEKALGDDYDIRDFHEAVLATGPVPLVVMEEQVDGYIKAQLAE